MSRSRLIAWAFIVPILLLHFVVKISPSVGAVYYSMTEWSGIGAAEFVGLENFRQLLFEDRSFCLPIQLFLVPLFSFWLRIGLVNTHLGVILIYIALGSPFSTFLMRSYFLQIPDDFRDAARVEGAGELGIFWRIMVPLTWPAFLTVALVNSMNIWNEFLIATVFLTKTEKFTVVTSYQAFTVRFGRDWTLTSAASLMMIFPIVAMFLALQRRFVQGLTQGGLKS